MNSADVTVVVVTWQGRHLLEPCLTSLAAQTLSHDVLVVDNASTDGTAEYLRTQWPTVRVLPLDANTGFAGGVAAALEQVQTRYLALLNNDATAAPDWLAASMSILESDRDCAAVSARMLLAETTPPRINNAGIVLLHNGYGADRGLGELDGAAYAEGCEVFGASGGACVLRTLAVKAVGGIDPGFFLYYEDTDLCWRLRLAGWRIRYAPDAQVWHRHAASSNLGSKLFAFHNERNRLLTVARNAPLCFAVRCWGRYLVTTLSLALRRRKTLAWQQHPSLRMAAFGSALKALPARWSSRRRFSAADRIRVLRDWRGR